MTLIFALWAAHERGAAHLQQIADEVIAARLPYQ